MGETDACVGLCYYMKILEIEKRKRQDILDDPKKRRKV